MNTLSAYVRTTGERDVLLEEVASLIGTFYRTDEKEFTDMLNTQVSLRTAELLHSLLTERETEITARNEVKSLLEEVKEELSTLATIEITLAIKPQHNFLNDLSLWINTNIKEQTLIQLIIDPQILGGIILLHNGRYINLSLKKKITDFYSEYQNAVPSLLS